MKAKRTIKTNDYKYWSCYKLQKEWYKIMKWMRKKECDMPDHD